MEAVGLTIVLVILGLFVAFPLYVLVRLATLGSEVDWLKRRVSEMAAAPSVAVPAVMPQPQPRPAPAWEIPLPAPPAQRPVTPASQLALDRIAQARSAAPAAPQPPSLQQPAVKPDAKPLDLESLIGANWLAKLGIAAIALAAAFFLQYAFRTGLIGPSEQVLIGLLGAGVMAAAGQAMVGRPQYRNYAQVLSSGGIVVFFLSIFAAYDRYHLIGYVPAFAALTVGALAASALAAANNTESVAVICLLGAFVTPALIRNPATTHEAASLSRLYGYLVLLNLWAIGLIKLRGWHSLAVVSFGSTWLLFFGAGPLQSRGWPAEGFAGLYFLLACLMGAQALYSDQTGRTSRTGPTELPDVVKLGIGLLIGGCAVFIAASSMILNRAGMLGLPDVAIAGTVAAVAMAALAAALPAIEGEDQTIRQLLGGSAVAVMVATLLLAMGSAKSVPAGHVAHAFGFALFNYLLFLAVSLILNRREETRAPALALACANGFVHIVTVSHVLASVSFNGVPAVALWLPVAGWMTLLAVAFVSNSEEDSGDLPQTLAVVGMLLPLAGLGISAGGASWTAAGGWMFLAEFAVMSLTGVALADRVRSERFRADLWCVVGAAAVFFGLIAKSVGIERASTTLGIAPLAGFAIIMAAYHAVLGAVLPRPADGDRLYRLTFFGLAVTFLTVAIPLQLKAGFVTVAWAVEAGALIWMGITARESRARGCGYALLTLAAVKAVAMDIARDPSGDLFLLNTRMLAGAAVVVACYAATWMLWRARAELSEDEQPALAGLPVVANVLTLLYVSVDLWQYVGRVSPGGGHISAQQLALSLFWTLYALVMVSVGIWQRSRPVRLFAMGLLYLSIAKVFLLDLSGIEQPFKIVSFLALGIILLLVSLLYTRFEDRLHANETG